MKTTENFRLEISEAAARDERKRIARELHDRVLQQLSGIRLRAEACRQTLTSNPDALARELEAVERSVDAVIVEIRSLLADSQTETDLAAGSLERRLREEIQIFCARSGVKLNFQCHMGQNQLPYEVEREFYFALREGVINAIRHSRASELELNLSQKNNQWIAILKDNGVGFDPFVAASTGHYGLRGMKQRMEKIGGQAKIQSAPGQGTQICLTVELGNKS